MFSGITPPVTLASACGLLLLALLYVARLVYTGKLVPRSFVDQLERDRDHWRAAAEALTPAVTELVRQGDRMLPAMAAIEQVSRALQRETERPAS